MTSACVARTGWLAPTLTASFKMLALQAALRELMGSAAPAWRGGQYSSFAICSEHHELVAMLGRVPPFRRRSSPPHPFRLLTRARSRMLELALVASFLAAITLPLVVRGLSLDRVTLAENRRLASAPAWPRTQADLLAVSEQFKAFWRLPPVGSSRMLSPRAPP